MILTDDIKDYIRQHKCDDVRKLALQKNQLSADMHTYVLQQIAGYQIAAKKVPTWAEIEDLQYPVHLSLEQCSSEQTARYKASLLQPASTFVDLTGGMGVDFSFMSRSFLSTTYVEQNEELCRLAAHNFPLLGLNVTIHHSTTENFLETMKPTDCLYLDPARRDDKGRKMVSIGDCTPNLLLIKNQLLEKCPSIWVKYSPMLDISLSLKELETVDELHIISLQNECKELLFHLTNHRPDKINIYCINLKKTSESECFQFCWQEEQNAILSFATELNTYLYEPNASLMKAGAFKSLSQNFSVKQLDKNSHLFTSNEWLPQFPGRKFLIQSSFSLNKQQLRDNLADCHQANISVRNFPLSAEQLKEKLKLKDGGDVYLFATTMQSQKIILKTKQL